MSLESLQSQIETLRQKKLNLNIRRGQASLHDYYVLIDSFEEMIASAAQELGRVRTEIQAERQSYKSLFRFMQVGYFVTDLKGMIREANDVGGSLLGARESELIGHSLVLYVPESERSRFSKQVSCLNESKNFHQWETLLIHKHDGEFHAEVSVSVIHDYQGQINGLRWWIRDMSQSRQIEERLDRNTGQLIESQQAGHIGSWEWDIEKNEVTWSDEMYRIYGLEPQSAKMSYESFLEYVHPQDHEQVRAAVEKSFQSQQPFSFDHRVIHPDGTERHIHAHGMVFMDGNGKVVRMFGTGQDITGQRQVEEELRRLNFELEQRVEKRTQELRGANERLKNIVIERIHTQEAIQQLNRELRRRVSELQTVLNVLPIGVTVAYDPQSHYITTNTTGQQILGVTRDENMPTLNDSDQTRRYKVLRQGQSLPVQERPLHKAMLENAVIHDAEVDLEYEDGTRVNLLAYASPLYDEQEKVRGGVAAFIDMTKRRIIEKRLALQYAVARALAESDTLNEASLKILQFICAETGWQFGIFWNFDRDANHLYVENIWQEEGISADELVGASRNLFPAPGQSLPGTVYTANEPLWLTDFTDEHNFPRKEAVQESGFQSMALFPLRRGEDEVLGVLEFFNKQIQPPTPDLMEMFEALASQVGEFMGRKYAEELRAIQLAQQEIVTQLSKRALLNNNLQELMDEACAQVAQTLSVEFSNVWELNSDKQQILFRSNAGWEDNLLHTTLDLEPESQFHYGFSNNQPIIFLDLETETRFQPAPLLTEHQIVSGISVVIAGRSQPFGLLEAYSTRHRSFTQNDINFLTGIAHVLAAAIQHHDVEEALRLSRNQISVILRGIADGITAQNRQGQIIYANDTAARIFGYANTSELMSIPPESDNTSTFRIFDEAGVPLSADQLPGNRVLRGETPMSMTIRIKVLQSGKERWTLAKSQVVTNEMGQLMMVVNIFHDITDLKRSEIGQRLLAKASVVLANDLDYSARMNDLANILVTGFADWCAVDILDENKVLQRVAVAHMDPEKVAWAREIHKLFPPDPNAAAGAYKVIHNNQSEYYPIITREMIESIENPEHRKIIRHVGLSSLIIAPLTARGHTFGTLSVIWAESGHYYTTRDLQLIEELARRAALALDNARLYGESQSLNLELEEQVTRRTIQLQRANARLLAEVNERKMAEEKVLNLNVELEERVADRTSQLESVNQKLQREIFERELTDEALRSSLQKTRELYEISQKIGLVNTPDELLQALLSSSYLKSAIRASVAAFDHTWRPNDPPPAKCTILTAWNKQRKTLLYIGQEMLLPEYGIMEPYSQNDPIFIEDIRTEPRLNENMRQRLLSMDVVGSVIFPLVAAGEWYGALSLHFDQIISLNMDDIRHLQGLVDEVAVGIYNFRLLETEALARREAEEANNLKLKFLAMISHELRTPLTSIKGFSTTLLADDVEWQAESQRDFIETISVEADKLTDLIEQLLNLSRLEAGTIRITPRHVEWNQVILTSQAQLNTLTINHRLVIEEPRSEIPILNIDVIRISQVVTNLVNNAVKYSPPNTTITIIAEQFSEEFIKVSVVDEGMGIPPESRNQVFEAFKQLDRERGTTQGAGLGLSICQGLIEAHGGRIWVDEHVGPGTTISFTLPIAY